MAKPSNRAGRYLSERDQISSASGQQRSVGSGTQSVFLRRRIQADPGRLPAVPWATGHDAYGPAVDPDTQSRQYSPHELDTVRAFMERRFPALTDAPMTEFRVCQYELSDDADFVIDRHPLWTNAWVVGGGSGHGFKHGPAAGSYVADLLAGRLGAPEPRFLLSRPAA